MSNTCFSRNTVQGDIPAQQIRRGGAFAGSRGDAPARPVQSPPNGSRHRVSLQSASPDSAASLGKMIGLVPRLAANKGCRPGSGNGFRLAANSVADGGQEVPHLHFHIIGGPRPRQRRVAATA